MYFSFLHGWGRYILDMLKMGQKLMIKLSHIKLAAIKTKYSSVILSELIINNGRPNQMSNNFPLW